MLASRKHERLQSFADRAKSSKTRLRTAALQLWRFQARSHYRAAFRSSSTARSSEPLVSAVTLRKKMKISPRPERIAQRRGLKEAANESAQVYVIIQSCLFGTPIRSRLRGCLF